MTAENLFGKTFGYAKRVVAAYKHMQEAKQLPLHERHREIIESIQKSMVLNPTRRHYIEDVTVQCLREIALKEGRGTVAPQAGEWLSRWRLKRLPSEYIALSDYLQELFQRHYARLTLEQQRDGERAKERRHTEYEQWFSLNRTLVEKFLDIADRKVSALDDYGDENWDALPKEINTFLLKIAKTENDNGTTENKLKEAQKTGDFWMVPEKYVWLRVRLESEFRKFHEARSVTNDVPDFAELSGTDFENYLARLLKHSGFVDVRGTAVTGDQGADLIAKTATKTVVIQAKRYQGSVGNKAVQEVVAAVKFYHADEGWVVTSGSFTAPAKALAHANHVRLIDGYALRTGSPLIPSDF